MRSKDSGAMGMDFSVAVEAARLADGSDAVGLKLSEHDLEVNLVFEASETKTLSSVSSLAPDARALRIGRSANSPAHWARTAQGEVVLLIGNDDETWDIGVTLSPPTFEVILREIRALETKR